MRASKPPSIAALAAHVARSDVVQRARRARRSFQREQAQFDVVVAGGRANQIAELAFRYFQRLVAHIID
jgi:hypothetical protein